MQGEDSRIVVERFLQAARERDLALLHTLAAEDLRVIEAGSLPYGGEHVGVGAFLALSRQVFRQLGITELRIDRIIAEGAVVVVLATIRGTPPGKAAFEMPIAEVWRLEGGKIREIRPFYLDTHRLRQAIGIDEGKA